MEKINIAELLKDCPKGMELDCILVSNPVRYNGIDDGVYLINICTEYGTRFCLTKEGYLYALPDSKCVIFPKGKTTWEGFVPPCEFKDGDILATDLGSVFYLNTRLNTSEYYGCYVGIGGDGSFHICEPFAYKECCRFATKEERTRLFDAIKENGYEWNEKTKILERLISPQFKVGNRIKEKQTGICGEIISVQKNRYDVKIDDKGLYVYFREQDNWELVPKKFDITTLKPFDKVLVRDTDKGCWGIHFYEGYDNEDKTYPYRTLGGIVYKQCIPYKGNEDLAGFIKDCDDYYKTWINEED